MALEIMTVGAQVLYAFEQTAGTRPTTGYTQLSDVNEAPDFMFETEGILVTNITDTKTRYGKGRADVGANKQFTLNHTDAVITAWDTIVTNYNTNIATGKRLWFEYKFPNASKSFFFTAAPCPLGTDGIKQNAQSLIPVSIIPEEVLGWETAST